MLARPPAAAKPKYFISEGPVLPPARHLEAPLCPSVKPYKATETYRRSGARSGSQNAAAAPRNLKVHSSASALVSQKTTGTVE
jgi:hypothetical protein